VWLYTGFGLVIRYIGQLLKVTTNNCHSISVLRTPKITVTTSNIKSAQFTMYSLLVAWWRISTMSSASVLTLFLAGDCLTTNSFLQLSTLGRSVKLLLAFANTLIPCFSFLEIHDQDFYSLLDMYVFRNGASSSTKESVFLCRFDCQLPLQLITALYGPHVKHSSSVPLFNYYCANMFVCEAITQQRLLYICLSCCRCPARAVHAII
jgi:hypothetical protein